jgi:hypothetical protein
MPENVEWKRGGSLLEGLDRSDTLRGLDFMWRIDFWAPQGFDWSEHVQVALDE